MARAVGFVVIVFAAGAISAAACRSPPRQAGPDAAASASAAVLAASDPGDDAGEDARDEAGDDASTAVEDAAGALRGFVCVPPRSGDFDRCPKGAMAGEEALRSCRERQAGGAPRRPTFRVGGSGPQAFSPTRWRCVEVPLGAKVHVTIDTLAGFDEVVASSCPSRAIDMSGPNQYGSIFFRCSRRDRAHDEVVARE